jgi:O-antigen biosynthesis protein WbqP
VHELVPGLTGWAQINGRDELPIPDKVKLDVEYLQRQSFWFDVKILWLTFIKVVRRDGVSH